MRKLIWLAFFFSATTLVSNAQENTSKTSTKSPIYKAFKVDLLAGYAIPSGTGSKAGVNFSLEPKYNLTNNIAVGLKYELAIMAAGYSNLPTGSVSVDAKGVSSYLVTGDYTFGTSKVRPFAGLGLGFYSFASTNVNLSGTGVSGNSAAYTKFGFAPRAGMQAGHFRLAVEYNIVGNYKYDNDVSAKNSYLGIKLGVTFGGGKK